MRHTINIYQRPAQGNNFLNRHVALNYRHRISANGWYDTATCDIVPDADQYNVLLDDYIGTRVAVFGSNPLQPVWEGIVNRISYVQNGVSFSNSLDSMSNAVHVQYTVGAGMVTPAAVTNADSIAKFGRKGVVLNWGNTMNISGITPYQNTQLALLAWPQKSMVAAPGQANSPLRLELIGMYHTLGWFIQTNSSTVAVNMNTLAGQVSAAAGAASNVWFSTGDLGLIVTNAAASMAPISIQQLTGLEASRKIVETGDSSTQWIFGISPTDPNLRIRRYYYRQANYTIRYTARIRDGLRIRDLYGRLVDPSTVQPDCGIRITDLTTVWNGVGDNPAETYIESVDYDATSGRVTLVSADDPRIEGQFQIARYGKPRHSRFNQYPRVLP